MKLNNSSRCRPRPCLCLPHSRPPNGVSLTNHHWPWILTSAANDSLISQWVFLVESFQIEGNIKTLC